MNLLSWCHFQYLGLGVATLQHYRLPNVTYQALRASNLWSNFTHANGFFFDLGGSFGEP